MRTRNATSAFCVWRSNCARTSSTRLRSMPIHPANVSATVADSVIHGMEERSASAPPNGHRMSLPGFACIWRHCRRCGSRAVVMAFTPREYSCNRHGRTEATGRQAALWKVLEGLDDAAHAARGARDLHCRIGLLAIDEAHEVDDTRLGDHLHVQGRELAIVHHARLHVGGDERMGAARAIEACARALHRVP